MNILSDRSVRDIIVDLLRDRLDSLSHLALHDLGRDTNVRLGDQLIHRCLGELELESLQEVRRMRNRWHIGLRVKLGVLIGRVDIRKLPILGLRNHIALALLEHSSGLRLVRAVLGHNLLELLVLVMGVLDLLAVRRNQEPLVHIDDINIDNRIILLQTFSMGTGILTGLETSTDLHAKLLILLRKIRTDERNTCEKLPRNRQVVCLEGSHIKEMSAFLLTMEELRKVHNKCKREHISCWVPPNSHVLDCGCGRGGDWHKWKAVGARVTAIDPDVESLKEAEERAMSMNFGVWFLGQGDIRQAAFAGPFDVVSYNFSMHYIFEDPKTFENSIKALGVAVRPGGLLIGITPEKARASAMVDRYGHFKDRLGNEFAFTKASTRILVNLVGGPFYADGGREEPILDANVLVQALMGAGFDLVTWEPMLDRPNGLISDLYSKFVFKRRT